MILSNCYQTSQALKRAQPTSFHFLPCDPKSVTTRFFKVVLYIKFGILS